MRDVQVPMKVKDVERLLETELHEFHHSERSDGAKSRVLRATSGISVPEHLHPFLSFVNVNTHPLGLRALASSSVSARARTVNEQGEGGTLGRLRRMYNIPFDLVVTNETNTQCVPSFYQESYSPDDLAMFYNTFLPGADVPTMVDKGGRENIPAHASTEASLDVQYISGIARNALTYVWTMNGSNPYSVQDEPFVEFMQGVLEMDHPPYVVSVSYSDDEENIFNRSEEYARLLDALLIKMGLRGITVLIASGDDGVAGLRPEFAKLEPDEFCSKNGPQWPSGSPYVTSVGATMHLTQSDVDRSFFRTDEEVVCSGEMGGAITTGGGFSNEYSMPNYQKRAVNQYLQQPRIPTTPGFFNASGRAYPDISALGAAFNVFVRGHMTSVSGTSASTPVIAGMVTLWNDIRLNAGKSPLGFINPLVYYLAEEEPSAFHDVVVGNNAAMKGMRRICDDSFGAAAGWDAVTGVGTPNFQVIADFIRGLDDHFNLSSPQQEIPTSCGSSATIFSATDTKAAATAESEDGKNEETVLGTMLVAAIGLAGVVICAVIAQQLYKRWRNQYSSLCAEPSISGSSEISSPRAPASNENGDGDDDDEATEMSEISLHDNDHV